MGPRCTDNPLTPTVAIWVQPAINILCQTGLPDVKNYKWRLNPVWYRMGRQSTGRQTNWATQSVNGRQCPNCFMYFVHVFIFVNYSLQAGLTLSRIWWHRLRDHCLSMKVQNVVMFVVMPLSKCQYLLTFHKTWTSAQSMPASSLASTKCATGSSETVSSGGMANCLVNVGYTSPDVHHVRMAVWQPACARHAIRLYGERVDSATLSANKCTSHRPNMITQFDDNQAL